MVTSSPHSKDAAYPLYPTYIQRRQSPGCRIRCLDVCMAPFFILIKYLFTVTFPEVTPIKIAAYNVCTPIRRASIPNTDCTPAQGRMCRGRSAHVWLLGAQSGAASWKTAWRLLTRQNIGLSSYSAVTFLGICPGQLKRCVHTKTCPRMFMAAVLVIVKTWKQPRRPSVGERIHELYSIQTMECYSVIKRNEPSSLEKTQRKPKRVLVSESSHSGKATDCIIPTLGHSGKGTTIELVERPVVARGWEGAGRGEQVQHRRLSGQKTIL